jgi:hypothetical protein
VGRVCKGWHKIVARGIDWRAAFLRLAAAAVAGKLRNIWYLARANPSVKQSATRWRYLVLATIYGWGRPWVPIRVTSGTEAAEHAAHQLDAIRWTDSPYDRTQMDYALNAFFLVPCHIPLAHVPLMGKMPKAAWRGAETGAFLSGLPLGRIDHYRREVTGQSNLGRGPAALRLVRQLLQEVFQSGQDDKPAIYRIDSVYDDEHQAWYEPRQHTCVAFPQSKAAEAIHRTIQIHRHYWRRVIRPALAFLKQLKQECTRAKKRTAADAALADAGAEPPPAKRARV